MITLAHISDIHLAPLPSVSLRALMSKRITGFINWKLQRNRHMRRDTLTDLVAHMRNQQADLVAVTGDMVNLGLDAEAERAANWLTQLGGPETVCLVPGNHDAYVPGALEAARTLYGDYMSGTTLGAHPFPFVRRHGDVAVIGLSSAIATGPFIAAGRLGKAQIARAARLLKVLGAEGLFRVVLIHHPPQDEFARSRSKGLWDAPELRDVLAGTGAELILHGHTHISSVSSVPGPTGDIPVVGVASASAAPDGHDAPARYNLFDIEKVGTAWNCLMREYGYQRIGDDITMRLQMRIY
ncbi:metallophosphoesterase family protein [Pelagibacterium montanilacus]|uniref:metallophosphoesterase family protein n=1 Tax=Pelagibacterium montanilacus TaxID=2185280 RepID=UPI000F8F30D2|nr:metallophosphoesterase [Pelagibacterium montanilacus]